MSRLSLRDRTPIILIVRPVRRDKQKKKLYLKRLCKLNYFSDNILLWLGVNCINFNLIRQ